MNVDHMDRVKKNYSHDADCCCLRVCVWLYERLCVFQDASRLPRVHVFVFFNLSEALRKKELMTMSGCEAGISLLTSSIPHLHFISGHATSRGPHVKGQAGLRYHCDCMLPYGQGRQAGRQEVLNPRLERSRSQAAGKLSSVPPSASQLSPLSYLGDQAWCHVMVDIIALSSIYLFPSSPSLGWK